MVVAPSTPPPALRDEELRGSPKPLQSTGALAQKFKWVESTPTVGVEFDRDTIQLAEVLKSADSDALIRDLAILVSQHGVAFFRDQNITIDEQRELGRRLGELSGKPESSKLHVHPLTETTSELGNEISVISSERRREYVYGDRSAIATKEWHADITFEPVPSDYAILKMHTIPESNGRPTGGDTLWASGYEAYDRLSPSLAAYLETLTAYHEARFFQNIAKSLGNAMRTDIRGSPLNFGPDLDAVHPLIRVNPVTGWKSLYVNRAFTKRILGVTKDESDTLLNYLFNLVDGNHDLQVRFKWEKNSLAIWDNRSFFHAATFDYESVKRVGDRVVSLGEKPFYDPSGLSRRQALGLPPSHGWVGTGPRGTGTRV